MYENESSIPKTRNQQRKLIYKNRRIHNAHKGRETNVSQITFEIVCFHSFVKKTPKKHQEEHLP